MDAKNVLKSNKMYPHRLTWIPATNSVRLIFLTSTIIRNKEPFLFHLSDIIFLLINNLFPKLFVTVKTWKTFNYFSEPINLTHSSPPKKFFWLYNPNVNCESRQNNFSSHPKSLHNAIYNSAVKIQSCITEGPFLKRIFSRHSK